MNLKQLSELLNLSPTTVSRALNGYPEVSEKTRKRVLEAARQMNYRPNARAQGLATGRAMAVGHVLPMTEQHQMVNPIFGDFIAGAGEVYSRASFDMMLSLVEIGREEDHYRTMQARGQVDAMVISAPRMSDPRIALLSDLGIPFVVHGRSSNESLPYSWLDTNNYGAFKRATDFLLDLGHRRIGLINGLEYMDFAYRRRAGYTDALTARGIPADPALMRSLEMSETYGFDATNQMLDLPEPATAFLVSSVISAFGVRRAIQSRGLEMGRDVSVITHDDDLSAFRNDDQVPIFTATRSSIRAHGRGVADMILQLINDPGCGPLTRLLEADLVIGRSTGPAPD